MTIVVMVIFSSNLLVLIERPSTHWYIRGLKLCDKQMQLSLALKIKSNKSLTASFCIRLTRLHIITNFMVGV